MSVYFRPSIISQATAITSWTLGDDQPQVSDNERLIARIVGVHETVVDVTKPDEFEKFAVDPIGTIELLKVRASCEQVSTI